MENAEQRRRDALDRLLWFMPSGVQKGTGLHRHTVNVLVKEGLATVKDFYDEVWPPRPHMAKDKNWEANLTEAGIREAFREGFTVHPEDRCPYPLTCEYHTPFIENRIPVPSPENTSEGKSEVAQIDKLVPVRITVSVWDNVFTETGTWEEDDGDGTVHTELHRLAKKWSGSKPLAGEVTIGTLGWMLDTVGHFLSLDKLSGPQARAAKKFADDHQGVFDAAGGVEMPVQEAKAVAKKAPSKKSASKESKAKQADSPDKPQRGVMVKGDDGMYRLPILNQKDELLGWTVYGDPKGKPVRNEDV
ncbi:hypothetical protein [Streptomyces sp. CFMR 7]|uniref:hypothetical protein n=1 Tax=Streptomyces sp. CFMR 7 TaxID=1649184 RepID=UPI0011A6DE6C|nr:hypothetical protein [Streptomyces sp. CFMR 7]